MRKRERLQLSTEFDRRNGEKTNVRRRPVLMEIESKPKKAYIVEFVLGP